MTGTVFRNALISDGVSRDYREGHCVPTLAVVEAFYFDGREFGLPQHAVHKIHNLLETSTPSLVYMKEAGVKVGFGTGLLAEHHDRLGIEFALRAEVFGPMKS